MFYFLITLIVLLPSLYLLWVYMRQPLEVDYYEQKIKRLIALYHKKMDEIDADLAKGFVSEPDVEHIKADYGRELIKSVEALETTGKTNVSGSIKPVVVFAMLVCLPLLAALFYWQVGAYQDQLISDKIKTLSEEKSPEHYAKTLDELQTQMSERLKQRPNNLDYRLFLAQLAMQAEAFDEARVHYAMLTEMLPEDADAWAYYAQAAYLANSRTIDAEVASAMDKALAINPDQTTVLGMLGISAFEQADYAQAIDVWQRLIKLLPGNSRRFAMISQGIQEASKRLGADAAVQSPAQTQAGIAVSVRLAPSHQAIDPNTLVFIYAKAANGPPMPLAAERVRVGDLPITVQLSKANAMTQAITIEGFDELIIGARVSFSGNAISQSGDVLGQSDAIVWRDTPEVSIEINEVLP